MAVTRVARRLLRYEPDRPGIAVAGRGIGYWWGHDTLEDKEKRAKQQSLGQMIEWKGQRSELQKQGKYKGYLPARIEDEAEDYFKTNFNRFNPADYFGYVRQPWVSFLTNYPFYVNRQVNKMYQKLVDTQLFNKDRVLALGPDLSAAYFVTALGGRVRFVGKPDWVELDKKLKLDLPRTYESGWHVEAIDLSTTDICYEGLHNVRNLLQLKYLDISYCPNLDDFAIDRIVGEYQDTLETLDISGCVDLNFGSLECLWKLRRLKTLVLYDLDHIFDLKLLCVLLLEIFPDLDIRGVDYIDADLLKGTEHEGLIDEYDKALEKALALPPGEIKSAKQVVEESPRVDGDDAIKIENTEAVKSQ